MSWVRGYARQAQSDLDARDVLARQPDLPQCHQLHFVQMACEKLAKAHLIAGGNDPHALQGSHAYIAKQLPMIANAFLAREAGRLPRDTWVIRAIRSLARRIELLAPAVDDGGRAPSNCEYPWIGPTGAVVAPRDYDFGLLLHEKAGVTLLKIVRQAIAELGA